MLCQECDNLVYYICDDGSGDNTRAIIEEYARVDSRIAPIYIDDKSRRLIDLIPDLISTILLENDDGFFVSIDADDEYKPGFLAKMLSFAEGNDLDMAVCGSDSIDALTGEMISRKELGYDLVISGQGFPDKFPVYRRYVYDFWGKIYTLPIMRKAYIDYKRSRTAINGRVSELFNYMALKACNKVGILGESLHKYYIDPNSYTSGFIPGHIEASVLVYEAARGFLSSFGEIGKTNQDYLYAIFLGQISDTLSCLYRADLPFDVKQGYISQVLDHPLTKEMMAHEAGAQFQNLAERGKFISEINKWAKA
jgi:glycosyltransferase involved in cell wall biosynthesis